MNPSRAQVWARLGPPIEQVGSVNEPRLEHIGEHDWNEKWIYCARDGTLTLALWYRYDWVGLFRQTADGALEREAGFDPE